MEQMRHRPERTESVDVLYGIHRMRFDVAGQTPHAVAGIAAARLRGDVGEAPIPVVAIEAIGRTLVAIRGRPLIDAGPVTAVDQIEVQPSVAIIVKERAP